MAIGTMTLAAFLPQISSANGFTGAQFAEWDVTNQDSYIETSVTMAGVVIAQTNPSQASCVNDWYFKDRASLARNPEIRKTIVAYGDAHPSGIILAILIRECGALDGS